MTPQEEVQLRELQADLVRAGCGDAEPHCIALAFASPLAGEAQFTMQTWIDLEAIRSPLLRGEEFDEAGEMLLAGRAFGLEIGGKAMAPDEAQLCLEAMREAIASAFSLSLNMKPEGGTTGDNQGFGSWLPIYACLVTECGLDPEAALRLPVGRAFALIAAHRHNQGWHMSGTPYALRDAGAGDFHSSPSKPN